MSVLACASIFWTAAVERALRGAEDAGVRALMEEEEKSGRKGAFGKSEPQQREGGRFFKEGSGDSNGENKPMGAAVQSSKKAKHAAASEANRRLKAVYEATISSLTETTMAMRHPNVRGDKIAMLTFEALTVQDVHSRDIVASLIADKISSVDAFEWVCQLRYYWDSDSENTGFEKNWVKSPSSLTPHSPRSPGVLNSTRGGPAPPPTFPSDGNVIVRIMTSARKYGYEYLGNTPRLVITPLTDKCYRTCFTALDMFLGGAPAGPAGTGKTETVKDMSKALAVHCVVFNCSEGLDHVAMGKLFKGLAQTGAWACFDEFNRIEVEVLSVVAQQIVELQNALRRGDTRIEFQGTRISVHPQFSTFITMNPGYAGRTELPDNLKALFRPVAMMVPDYSLIAEIELYTFGFQKAAVWGNKVVTVFKLCSEQLSPAFHYDYGMRAVKAVISTAGFLRWAEPDADEEELIMRAIWDVNVPKFLAEDLPLFQGILSDLFPGLADDPSLVDPSDEQRMALRNAISSSAVSQGLQNTQFFTEKCEQLYDTMLVRHGLMVVGAPGGCKSSVIDVTSSALSLLASKQPRRRGSVSGNEGKEATPAAWPRVDVHKVWPKAVTLAELFGYFDENTREWRDGVLSNVIRASTQVEQTPEAPVRSWIVSDGPVDAMWIEDMNTVLDDNKKLCLTSGEMIHLTPEMSIMFETDDLSHASPATVSRCGMVYIEPASLGEDVLLHTWVEQHPELKAADRREIFRVFDTYVVAALDFVHDHCTAPLKISRGTYVASVLRVLDIILCFDEEDSLPRPAQDRKEKSQGANKEVTMASYLICAIVWGIGGSLDGFERERFESFLRHQVDTFEAKVDEEEYEPVVPAPGLSLFDHFIDKAEPRWRPWLDGHEMDNFVYSPNMRFSDIFVPTSGSAALEHLTRGAVCRGTHLLLAGPPGTGKTALMSRVQHDLTRMYIPASISLSAQTSANAVQGWMSDQCVRRKRRVFGPPVGYKLVLLFDDFNLPQKEPSGAQPPLEAVRQLLTVGGWYHVKSMQFRSFQDYIILGSMAAPAGHQGISERLQRHFITCWVPELSNTDKRYIFGVIMNGFFQTFPAEVKALVPNIISATVDIYDHIRDTLRPTPRKAHYLYNMRDVARVFQGITLASPSSVQTKEALSRLWAHEVARVLRDRLLDPTDAQTLDEAAMAAVEKHLPEVEEKDTLLAALEHSLVFGDFVRAGAAVESRDGAASGASSPRGSVDSSLDSPRSPAAAARSEPRGYHQLPDIPNIARHLTELLEDFNMDSPANAMDLVFFDDAVKHLSRLLRVLQQPRGHMLLLGFGGTGRRSLTRLASYLSDYNMVQITASNAKGQYTLADWHEDLRTALLDCGINKKATVLLIVERDLHLQQAWEDINSALNTGHVQDLYSSEEMETISSHYEAVCQRKGIPATRLNIYAEYLAVVQSKLHVIISMAPVGSQFREKLRMFPSLTSCCTIDWYASWPSDALRKVATVKLRDFTEFHHLLNLGQPEDSDEEDDEEEENGEAKAAEDESDESSEDEETMDQDTDIPLSFAKQTPEQKKDINAAIRALSEACRLYHCTAVAANDRMCRKMSRELYVTPATFLTFLECYVRVVEERSRSLREEQTKFETGVARLETTREHVSNMRQQLKSLQPKLLEAQRQADEASALIEKKTEAAKEKWQRWRQRRQKLRKSAMPLGPLLKMPKKTWTACCHWWMKPFSR